MTNQSISLKLEDRVVLRKRLAGMRKDGFIPAVVHNHGNESMHVMAEFITVSKVYQQAGKHHPVDLTINGKKHLALIKDVDFDPAKGRLRHVVFQAIKQNEEVDAEIPVVFLEDAEIPAERASLMVLKQLDHVEVKAFPRDLPDQLVIDPSKLKEVGDHLTVADLVVPEGVTILNDADQQIAIVEMPRDQIAEANAAAESLAEDAGKPDAETAEESTQSDDSNSSESTSTNE